MGVCFRGVVFLIYVLATDSHFWTGNCPYKDKKEDKRICGSDGVTYNSSCEFKTYQSFQHSLYELHPGPCHYKDFLNNHTHIQDILQPRSTRRPSYFLKRTKVRYIKPPRLLTHKRHIKHSGEYHGYDRTPRSHKTNTNEPDPVEYSKVDHLDEDYPQKTSAPELEYADEDNQHKTPAHAPENADEDYQHKPPAHNPDFADEDYQHKTPVHVPENADDDYQHKPPAHNPDYTDKDYQHKTPAPVPVSEYAEKSYQDKTTDKPEYYDEYYDHITTTKTRRRKRKDKQLRPQIKRPIIPEKSEDESYDVDVYYKPSKHTKTPIKVELKNDAFNTNDAEIDASGEVEVDIENEGKNTNNYKIKPKGKKKSINIKNKAHNFNSINIGRRNRPQS